MALLRLLHHVIDRLLDQIVRQVGTAALGRHGPGAAGEAVDGVLVEQRLALGNTRSPGRLVAGARSTGDALPVTSAAGLLEQLGAIFRDCRCGTGRSRGARLDSERRVVLPGDGLLAR